MSHEVNFLTTSNGDKVAYRKQLPKTSQEKSPWVCFLGGFASDMEGSKAEALDAYCQSQGIGYLRFDYRGHGRSDGDFVNLGIMDWYQDAKLMIEKIVDGPVILVGSSMGGWIAHLIARDAGLHVVGLIGIASAPDFTEGNFWASFSSSQKKLINDGGVVEIPSGYDVPYRIGHALIQSGRDALIMPHHLAINVPVRLLQGAKDTAVSIKTAYRLFDHIHGDDVELELIKDADHSFSRPQDIARIQSKISTILKMQS